MPIAKKTLKKINRDVRFELPIRKVAGSGGHRPDRELRGTSNSTETAGDSEWQWQQLGPLASGDKRKKDRQAFDRGLPLVDGLLVEFKKASYMDPFFPAEVIQKAQDAQDTEEVAFMFEKSSPEALRVRGQLAEHASLVFSQQHRTHIFQLLVCGSHVRYIFWDHSGAIVSDLFDYAKRGWDLSVEDANDYERRKFRKTVAKLLLDMNDPTHSQCRLPRAEDTLDDKYHVVKVTIEDDVLKTPVQILIQAPFFRSHSTPGRATRGYIAYHLVRRELVFFKDTWRIEHDCLTAERSILSRLSEAEVPFTPEVLCGGDVMANGERGTTRCSKWVQLQVMAVEYRSPRFFHHHRLLQPLAYPVQSAPNLQEFTRAFCDWIGAIRSADEKCDLLHRDISLRNVMIRIVDGKIIGILVDWKMAGTNESESTESVVNTGKRTKFRVAGTPAFMSIGLLQDADKPHEILDDLEAIFWALVYGASRYYEHEGQLPAIYF
ncbi:hypothetical protein BDY19DRAFT_1056432 [Irpex rosettiformis]|uniref:Uncharacterized protein n=1 Tax=Irpex rosettiformis TaxID=378272 RepID=A0ACB8U5A1_9APHY|nr:hypothetical protein BDY19DRAFT_1056432 [Irpex rosettiformis]